MNIFIAKAAVEKEKKRVVELNEHGFEKYEKIGHTFPGVDIEAVHRKWKILMAAELVVEPMIDFQPVTSEGELIGKFNQKMIAPIDSN